MAIQRLTVCTWQAGYLDSVEVPTPSWETVADAIRALDNRDRNDLYLYASLSTAANWLCVGGGDGRYILSGSTPDERFPTLVTRSTSPASIDGSLMVGGQEGEYPPENIVTLAEALVGAKAFFDTGTFDGPDWQEV